MRLSRHACLLSLLLPFTATTLMAEVPPPFNVTIRHHRFEPARLKIPADTKVRLLVHNLDATPEEFESSDFNREKLVLPNVPAVVYVGPLPAGTYRFFGDFHQDTAQGVLVVE